MKRKSIWAAILVAAIMACAGCGEVVYNNDLPIYTEPDPEVDGADWRTARDYGYLDWNTPEGQKSLVFYAYEKDGVIMLAPNEYSYNPYPFLPMVDGIHDYLTVRDNMTMKDYNSDGYDDLCVKDIINKNEVDEVFVYNPDTISFEYADEYSTVNAH